MTCAWIDTSSADTGSSATMNSRLDRKRPRDADPLPLPAGEFVRKPLGMLGREADECAAARAMRSRSRRARVQAVRRQRLASVSPTRRRGLRLAYGSWKMICMCRRYGRIARADSGARSTPSKRISPAVGSSKPQHAASDRALAGAGFADEAKRFAAADVEADVVDGTHRAVGWAEVLLEAAHGASSAALRRSSLRPLAGSANVRACARPSTSGGIGGFALRRRASPQRGANAQPGSGSSGLATWPGSRSGAAPSHGASPSQARRGRHASKPRVYGCCGARRARRTLPSSTMRPQYITTTRSAISATTPRLCVMNSRPCRCRGCSLSHQREDLRLDRDVERRRRLVGDQQQRIAGQRHGDHHALAHAAGQLVRIVARGAAPQPESPTRSSISQRALQRGTAIQCRGAARTDFGDLARRS